MSNILKLAKPALPQYRTYVQTTEPGALLVRVGHGTCSLARALRRVAEASNAATIELRQYFNGKENLVECWRNGKALFGQVELK